MCERIIYRGTPGQGEEALPLMKIEAKWQQFIPADLAFGERGPLADQTVIYEVELMED